MNHRFRRPACAGVLVCVFAAAVNACPICHTELGQQVRIGILGPDFAFNLFAVAAPFTLCLLVAAALRYALAEKESAPDPSSQEHRQ